MFCTKSWECILLQFSIAFQHWRNVEIMWLMANVWKSLTTLRRIQHSQENFSISYRRRNLCNKEVLYLFSTWRGDELFHEVAANALTIPDNLARCGKGVDSSCQFCINSERPQINTASTSTDLPAPIFEWEQATSCSDICGYGRSKDQWKNSPSGYHWHPLWLLRTPPALPLCNWWSSHSLHQKHLCSK